jgi:heme exporter protein B
MASSGLRVRETLLPLLFLPVVAPVLLAATKAWDGALRGPSGAGAGWLLVLGVFAAVYVAAGIVAFDPLLEDT